MIIHFTSIEDTYSSLYKGFDTDYICSYMDINC